MTESDLAPLLCGRVLALTGAGISVASGLPTFRGSGGMYEGRSAYDLASPEGFARDPGFVWKWYRERIASVRNAEPNAAHRALVDLERVAARVTIVSSNVDDLHQRAGSSRVFRLHGDILESSCSRCACVVDTELEVGLPRCACGGILRPNVVWFGEYPWAAALEAVSTELPTCSVVLDVGHSGSVSYGFIESALLGGKSVVRINAERLPPLPGAYDIVERAEVALPRLAGIAAAYKGLPQSPSVGS